MVKIVFKVILFILPILVVIGLFRVLLHQNDPTTFVPTYEELVNMFATAPDFITAIRQEVDEVAKAFTDVGASFSAATSYEIVDIGSFFAAVGDFFNAVGQFFAAFGSVFKLIFVAVSTPMRFLVWLFGNVLGFSPYVGV